MPLTNPRNFHASIDAKIRDYEQKIRTLKATRNKFSYISQIPDEILSIIFIVIRDSALELFGSADQLSWLRLSAVCRHWRRITLATPALWSYIDFNSLDCAETMIERSKAVPITLKMAFRGASDDHRLRKIVANAISKKSLREIDIQSSRREDIIQLLSNRTHRSAPFLESLKLTCITQDDYAPTNWRWYHMPSLRRLELIDMPLPQHFEHFAKLTYLKLDPPELISVNETLELLQHTPYVEELSIGSICNKEFVPTLRSVKDVSLPHLRSLELQADDTDSARILSSLSYPRSASVSLEFESDSPPDEETTEESFDHILKAWSHFAGNGRNAASGTRVTDEDLSAEISTNRADLTFTILIFNGTSVSESQKPILRLTYPLPVTTLIRPIIKTLSSRIKSLTLRRLKQSDSWVKFMSSFTQVQTVVLHRSHLAILDRLRPYTSIMSSRTMIWPELTTLVLSNYRTQDGAHMDRWRSDNGNFTNLFLLLKERPVKTVKVVNSAARRDILAHFRANNVAITWETTTTTCTEDVWAADSDSDSEY
ncbi:hypothetical protein ONZ45_g11492 [Pleurotus djamor]|nr:hypothetical protein ONZ45_g11492 [Pleurotus djamor]